VIATVRSRRDERVAQRAGAHHVIRTDERSEDAIVDRVQEIAPAGIAHVVEIAFDANVDLDQHLLQQGGTLAAYTTDRARPSIPFWPLALQSAGLFFLGSDDFPDEVQREAVRAINEVLEARFPAFEISARFELCAIGEAHRAVEDGTLPGRVVVTP